MAKLPSAFEQFRENYPEVFAAYEKVGGATLRAGPLDNKTRELVKLALSIGAGMEGATHSHARRAQDQGATAEEMRHVALLGLTTLGFPNMMKGLLWVEDVVAQD